MSESEHGYRCPDHGPVSPNKRQHGGRAHAYVCPRVNCAHTVKSTTVDWEAYHEAREKGENPPCPDCESEDINSVPAKPPFRCDDCGHAFGYAGAYR